MVARLRPQTEIQESCVLISSCDTLNDTRHYFHLSSALGFLILSFLQFLDNTYIKEINNNEATAIQKAQDTFNTFGTINF